MKKSSARNSLWNRTTVAGNLRTTRFLREARAAASIRHPNVALVFHLGRTGQNYFYAMEFVEGETLESLIKQAGPLLSATRGFGAPEALLCYESAERLCHSLNRPVLLYIALVGQWRHSLVTNKLSITMQFAQRIYSHSARPLKSRSSRSRFLWRHARKQPMQNTADKRREHQENVDFYYLLDS